MENYINILLIAVIFGASIWLFLFSIAIRQYIESETNAIKALEDANKKNEETRKDTMHVTIYCLEHIKNQYIEKENYEYAKHCDDYIKELKEIYAKK